MGKGEQRSSASAWLISDRGVKVHRVKIMFLKSIHLTTVLHFLQKHNIHIWLSALLKSVYCMFGVLHEGFCAGLILHQCAGVGPTIEDNSWNK